MKKYILTSLLVGLVLCSCNNEKYNIRCLNEIDDNNYHKLTIIAGSFNPEFDIDEDNQIKLDNGDIIPFAQYAMPFNSPHYSYYLDSNYSTLYDGSSINKDTTLFLKFDEQYGRYFDFSASELKEMMKACYEYNKELYGNDIDFFQNNEWYNYTVGYYYGKINDYTFIVLHGMRLMPALSHNLFGLEYPCVLTLYVYKDNKIIDADTFLKEKMKELYLYVNTYGMDDKYYIKRDMIDNIRNELILRHQTLQF